MKNAYEKLMIDPVGVIAVTALWGLSLPDCAADQPIKSFDVMTETTRNGP